MNDSELAKLISKYLRQMLEYGIQPDTKTMGAVINAFCKRISPEYVKQYYTVMEKINVKPGILKPSRSLLTVPYVKLLNQIIGMYSKVRSVDPKKRVEDMMNYYGDFRKYDLKPDIATRTALLKSLAHAGQLQEMTQIFNDMRTSDRIL